MDSTSEAERREARVTINKEFESFDAFIQEYVTNISRTGAFIKSKTPLPIGTQVNLRFTVIMVTRGAQQELGIVLGSPVVAVIKAGAVHLVPRMG